MYAVIKTGGKQYAVKEGEVVEVGKLNVAEGERVEFVDVLLVSKDDGDTLVGRPTLSGAKVVGTILKQKKGRKVLVFKYKPKKGYHKRRGHRQLLTSVRINQIVHS